MARNIGNKTIYLITKKMKLEGILRSKWSDIPLDVIHVHDASKHLSKQSSSLLCGRSVQYWIYNRFITHYIDVLWRVCDQYDCLFIIQLYVMSEFNYMYKYLIHLFICHMSSPTHSRTHTLMCIVCNYNSKIVYRSV